VSSNQGEFASSQRATLRLRLPSTRARQILRKVYEGKGGDGRVFSIITGVGRALMSILTRRASEGAYPAP